MRGNGVGLRDGGLNGLNWIGVIGGQTLRTALHAMNLLLLNNFGESHTKRLLRHKPLRELLIELMTSGLSVHPIFEGRNSNCQTKTDQAKIGSTKNWIIKQI